MSNIKSRKNIPLPKSIGELIDACGGDEYVADFLEIHRTAVYRWRERGIPEKWWCWLVPLFPGVIGPNKLNKLNIKARKK